MFQFVTWLNKLAIDSQFPSDLIYNGLLSDRLKRYSGLLCKTSTTSNLDYICCD